MPRTFCLFQWQNAHTPGDPPQTGQASRLPLLSLPRAAKPSGGAGRSPTKTRGRTQVPLPLPVMSETACLRPPLPDGRLRQRDVPRSPVIPCSTSRPWRIWRKSRPSCRWWNGGPQSAAIRRPARPGRSRPRSRHQRPRACPHRRPARQNG